MQRIRRKLLHPFAQNVLVNVEITCGLRNRHAPIPHQANSLELERPAETASSH
jgi:hypothetical protein